METCIAMDVGGTKLLIAEVTRSGQILQKKRYPTGRKTQQELLEIMIQAVHDYEETVGWSRGIDEEHPHGRRPQKMGIGIVGQLDPDKGLWKKIDNKISAEVIDLTGIMKEEFGVECRIDNDVKAACTAERLFGEAGLEKDFVYINIGTGLAVGIVSDGKLLRGQENEAGEIGYTNFTSGEGWCTEDRASGIGFRRQLAAQGLPEMSGEEILKRAKADSPDPIATELVEELIRTCALLIQNLSWTTAPKKIILGGGLMSDDWLFNKVKKAALEKVSDRLPGGIVPSSLDPNFTGLLGAAAIGFGGQGLTILDMIEKVSDIAEDILDHKEQRFAPLYQTETLQQLKAIQELVFVGSGTSDTSARTSRYFAEKVSGLPVEVKWPSEVRVSLEAGRVHTKALYIFTSQTGTSKETFAMCQAIREAGAMTLSLTESEETPLAKASPLHIVMGCGKEPFMMRTIGYCASVLDHCLLALELGRIRDNLTIEQYEGYIKEAYAAAESRKGIPDQVKAWFPKVRRQMEDAGEIVFTGAEALYGVALEGSVKFWEMPQKPCFAFELEEGLHGPNYGYNHHQCVIVLQDGNRETAKGQSLARYMKDIHENGILIGPAPVDEKDLNLNLQGADFAWLEVSAAVQTLSYLLTMARGRDISGLIDHSDMNSYFTTHG